MTFRLNPQDLPPLPPLISGSDATRPGPSSDRVGNRMRWTAALMGFIGWVSMLVTGETLQLVSVTAFGVGMTLFVLSQSRYQRFLAQELEKHPIGIVTATVSGLGWLGRNDLGRAAFVTFSIPQNCTSFTFLVTAKVYKKLKRNDRVTLTYQGWELLSFTLVPASRSN